MSTFNASMAVITNDSDTLWNCIFRAESHKWKYSICFHNENEVKISIEASECVEDICKMLILKSFILEHNYGYHISPWGHKYMDMGGEDSDYFIDNVKDMLRIVDESGWKRFCDKVGEDEAKLTFNATHLIKEPYRRKSAQKRINGKIELDAKSEEFS